MGTRGYTAPELNVNSKKNKYSFSTDTWSLGIVLLYIINNGTHPYQLTDDGEYGKYMDNRSDLTELDILNAITLIRDIATSMIIIDSILILCATILLIVLKNKYDLDIENPMKFVICVSVFGSLIDVCLTFTNIGIITQNDLINEVTSDNVGC